MAGDGQKSRIRSKTPTTVSEIDRQLPSAKISSPTIPVGMKPSSTSDTKVSYQMQQWLSETRNGEIPASERLLKLEWKS
ncbi:hypothetical protein B7494_g1630 [Chlorociboria aeruginascens]|nr:hypothetical protein B7494_g1630 [Chlorociboria aeruginascens]